MYIFELIAKKLKEKNTIKTSAKSFVQENSELQDYETCSHTFLPLDSTGEIFACSKCGQIIKKDEISYKSKNPFS